MTSRPGRIVLALPLLLASLAFAQDPPARADRKEDDPRKLEKIEVQAGDEVDERRESTAARIIVNREELLRHGDTSLLDAMKRLPGVTLGGAGGRGSAIRLRGLGAGYTQILVNGEPMPPGFNLEQVSPELVERVEIVRGAMAQFSARAIAGTINIVMRRAIAQRQREVKLGANLRNGRPSANASVQVSDRVGALAFTVPAAAYAFRFAQDNVTEQVETDAAGDVASSFVTRQPGEGRGGGFNTAPRLNWRIARDHTLASETFVNHHRVRGEFDERSATLAGRGPPYAARDLATSSSSTSARTNLTWIRPVGADGRIEVKAGLNRNTRSQDSALDALDAAGMRSLTRTADSRGADNGATTSGKLQVPVAAGHSLSAGWELARSTRREDLTQREVAFAGQPTFNLDESFEARVDRVAAYAQDEWQVGPKFSTYLGLRWEGIDTESRGDAFSATTSRSSVWSPIVHGLWKLAGKDQLRASVARTYKAPDTNNLLARRSFAIDNTATTPDFMGNPGLKPELSWGLDGAFERYFEAGGLFSVSAFVRRVEDVILREVVLEPEGRFVSRPVNGGRATIRGIEWDAKVNLGKLVAGAPAIDVRANLARNWSKVDAVPGPDNRLAEQTPLSGTLGADYRFPGARLTAGGSFTFKGGGPARTSASQAVYTSAVRTLDLYAVWKINATTQLRMTGSNLLGQDYIRVDRFTSPGASRQLTALTRAFPAFGAVLEVKL